MATPKSKAIHAVGKRKTSIARVWMKPGKGAITVNKRTIDEYFLRPTSKMIVRQPLELTAQVGTKLNVPPVLIKAIGKAGQARLLKLLEPSDATELTLDNSLFVRLNFEADQNKKCRQAFKNL